MSRLLPRKARLPRMVWYVGSEVCTVLCSSKQNRVTKSSYLFIVVCACVRACVHAYVATYI